MIWTLPNVLTMGRVLAAPVVAIIFVVLARPLADWVAFVIFVVAALTDFLDGYLARRWNQVTPLGRMLDPIADKAMVTIALAVLLALNAAEWHLPRFGFPGLPWELVLPIAVILLREVLISGLREHLGDVKIHVTQLAKWKTTVQMVAIALMFLGPAIENSAVPDRLAETPFWAWFGTNVELIGIGALWIAAALTAISGFDYFIKGLAHMRGRA